MSLSIYINLFSKDWEIFGDGIAKDAKFNISGWPFNLDLSEAPKMEMSAYAISGGGGKNLGAFTASIQDDRILLPSHGLVNGDQVRFVPGVPTNVLPAPLTEPSMYFVIGVRGNDFQVSLTSGGTLINLTDKGTGSNEAWLGGSQETTQSVVCVQEGSFITLHFAAPIPAGASKVIRLKAKIGL